MVAAGKSGQSELLAGRCLEERLRVPGCLSSELGRACHEETDQVPLVMHTVVGRSRLVSVAASSYTRVKSVNGGGWHCVFRVWMEAHITSLPMHSGLANPTAIM